MKHKIWDVQIYSVDSEIWICNVKMLKRITKDLYVSSFSPLPILSTVSLHGWRHSWEKYCRNLSLSKRKFPAHPTMYVYDAHGFSNWIAWVFNKFPPKITRLITALWASYLAYGWFKDSVGQLFKIST